MKIQEEIKRRFGAQVIKQQDISWLAKRNTFNAIKEKLGKKLVGWKEKMLSKADKEILIKAVVQAIPNVHHELLQTTRFSM